MTIRFISVIGIILFAMLYLQVDPAVADNGPHGNYTATTDACAGCHRTHTAPAPQLLIGTVPNLCYSCHGSTGTGADTDVTDGIYLERDIDSEQPEEGINNRGLRGGGFDFASMDTAWNNPSASSAVVTSKHLDNGDTGMAWGSGAIGSGAGTSMPLSCTSCHDPHGQAGDGGSPTYRLFRAIPLDSGAATGVNVTDQTEKVYSLTDTSLKTGNQYFGEEYDSQGDALSDWCSQCHTRYHAGKNSGHMDSGDPIFAYRHYTKGQGCGGCHASHGGNPIVTGGGPFHHHPTGCTTCHVAHGTSASMGGYSGSVPWPDGGSNPNGSGRSALLRVDNRGTCQLCHGK